MIERAREQVGDGRQTDVWMRPHVRAANRCEVPRTHVVEEDEWADHLTMANRQHAAHGVAITKITDAALQDIDDRLGVFGHGSRSEEHTSELQSLMRISYAVFCLKKKNILRHT